MSFSILHTTQKMLCFDILYIFACKITFLWYNKNMNSNIKNRKTNNDTYTLLAANESSDNTGIFTHRNSNGLHTGLHNHDFYEILYILSGDFKHVVNEREYFISKGDCAIITPNDWHYYEHVETSGKGLNRDILIKKELFEQICELVPSTMNQILTAAGSPMIKFTLQEISEMENCWKNFSKIEDIHSKQCSGISIILTIFSKIFSRLNQIANEPKNNYSPLVQNILEKFNRSIFLQEGIPAIIKDMGYSQAYICRIFKTHTGITLTEYLKNLRILNIAYYLETTKFSLSEIGYLVGIESLSYLNKIFKKTYGITPIQYRKAHKHSLSTRQN